MNREPDLQPPKQPVLRPSDVVVALELRLRKERSYRLLATSLSLCHAEVHNAVRRLVRSRLADEWQSNVELPALMNFLVHGVPYAYPPVIGGEVCGEPTAVLSDGTAFVWPTAWGKARGRSVLPLYRAATGFARENPRLHRALVLVDCLRLGDDSDRERAAAELREHLHPLWFKPRPKLLTLRPPPAQWR